MSGLIITVRNGLRQTVVVDVYAESNAPSSSSLPPPEMILQPKDTKAGIKTTRGRDVAQEDLSNIRLSEGDIFLAQDG